MSMFSDDPAFSNSCGGVQIQRQIKLVQAMEISPSANLIRQSSAPSLYFLIWALLEQQNALHSQVGVVWNTVSLSIRGWHHELLGMQTISLRQKFCDYCFMRPLEARLGALNKAVFA